MSDPPEKQTAFKIQALSTIKQTQESIESLMTTWSPYIVTGNGVGYNIVCQMSNQMISNNVENNAVEIHPVLNINRILCRLIGVVSL